MAFDLKKMVEDIENSATLTCNADAFGEDVINLLDSFDADYVDLENIVYSFEEQSDIYDEEDGFSDVDKIVEQVLQGNDEDAKVVVNQMIETKSTMVDIIFGAKLLIDEGIKTYGNFGVEKDDSKQKFANAADFVRGLEISPDAQDQILLSLAGRSSIINLLKRKECANDLAIWNSGSATVFDFKLQKVCNDEYSPVLKQAKELADERVFEYYREKLYKNMKNDIKNEENIK